MGTSREYPQDVIEIVKRPHAVVVRYHHIVDKGPNCLETVYRYQSNQHLFEPDMQSPLFHGIIPLDEEGNIPSMCEFLEDSIRHYLPNSHETHSF